MTDEEYLFRQTELERKRLGYGDKHKKRGGGRYVRLPSDHLTKKEREALNGECKTYKKKDFYTWEEFKELPSDLQVAWTNSIINRYGAGLETISEIVFGFSKLILRHYFQRKNEIQYLNKPLTGKAGQNAKKALAAAFDLWKNAQITMSEEDLPQEDPAPVEEKELRPFVKIDPLEMLGIKQPEEEQIPDEIEALPESPAPEAEEAVTPAPQICLKGNPMPERFDPANIAALIAALAGSGAKLTIEVVL